MLINLSKYLIDCQLTIDKNLVFVERKGLLQLFITKIYYDHNIQINILFLLINWIMLFNLDVAKTTNNFLVTRILKQDLPNKFC